MLEPRVAVVILAAGASTRMGTPKQLIKIGGVSLIRRAVKTAVATKSGPIIVVLGANAEVIRPELAGLEIFVTENSDWQSGMASSIRAGLKALLEIDPEISGVMLMVADQPGVQSKFLDQLFQAHLIGNAKLVAARYDDSFGTPAFFAREYFDELLQLDGQGGAKQLLERHRELVVCLNLSEAAAFDLDTPEDVSAFTEKISVSTSAPSDSPAVPCCKKEIQSDFSSDEIAELFEHVPQGQTRRRFIANVTAASAGIVTAPLLLNSDSIAANVPSRTQPVSDAQTIPVTLRVNGAERKLQLDPRVTLLDALREHLNLNGSKKGCDHGQCGACTVLVNGRRINACLALAVVHDDDEITTIEGLAHGDELHPMQTAFLEHDGFQCGYCTPGQICSAVALLKENHAGDDAEIREWMSGNICRCGAYPNIVSAIRAAKSKMAGVA